MSHAKHVTRDNRKSPEYHVVGAIRKLQTDTNCPAGKPWPNHVKSEHDFPAGQFVCPQLPYRGNNMIFWIFLIVSRVLHVTLANQQRFGFEFHLRSSPSAFSGYMDDQSTS